MSLLGGLLDRVRTVATARDQSPGGSADAGDGTGGPGRRDGQDGSSSRGASGRPTRSYVDLDAIPVRDADAYVDLEDLVGDRADAYVEVAPMVDDAATVPETEAADPDGAAGAGPDPTAGGSTGGHGAVDRRDVDPDGDGPEAGVGTAAGTGGVDPPEIEPSVTFEPSTGGDWVDALGADDEAPDDGEAPDDEFDVVTGFASAAERVDRGPTDRPAADTADGRGDGPPADDADGGSGTSGDGWSAAPSLDPEKVTRTRVSAADVDTGAAIGQAGDAPIDIDDIVDEPGDGAPAGLDPDNVTRASAATTDEAVAKLELFDSRATRRDADARRWRP